MATTHQPRSYYNHTTSLPERLRAVTRVVCLTKVRCKLKPNGGCPNSVNVTSMASTPQALIMARSLKVRVTLFLSTRLELLLKHASSLMSWWHSTLASKFELYTTC